MKKIIITLSALLVLSSCAKSVDDMTQESLQVSMYGDTKVHLNGLKTCWDKEDAVTIFYKSESMEKWIFQGNTGDMSGTLVHTASYRDFTSENIIGLYPYDAEATCQDGEVYTSIPSVQQYRESSYGTALLAAISVTDELSFKYCTALVELQYRGPAEISKIVMDAPGGESISGLSRIYFDGDKPVLTCTGTSSVTLECGVAIPQYQTSSFFFSVAPGLFSKGILFTVYFEDDTVQTVKVSEETLLTAGHIYTTEAVSPELPSDQKEMHIVFSDGKKKYNPFTSSISFDLGSEIGPYYYQIGDETYPFYMLCQGTTSGVEFSISKGGGLYIGGDSGDYIKLPAVEGFRLDRVSVSLHKRSNFQLVDSETMTQNVAGGECTGTAPGDFRMMYLTSTEPGVSYTMLLEGKSCFRSIILYYTK